MALARRLETAVRHHPPPTRTDLTPLPDPPTRAQPKPKRGKAGQTSGYTLPTPSQQPTTRPTNPRRPPPNRVGGSRLTAWCAITDTPA
jgi:hypothetical protein